MTTEVHEEFALAKGGKAGGVQDILMVNNSGVERVSGEVVVFDPSDVTGKSFTTTISADNVKVCGVVVETIAIGATGRVRVYGALTGASALKANGVVDIAIGDFLSTYSTAGVSQKATAQGGAGTAFATALEAYATDDSLGVIDCFIHVWGIR